MRQSESSEPHDRDGRRKQEVQGWPARWADGRTRPRPAAEAPLRARPSVSVSASIPIASSTEAGQRGVLLLALERSDHCSGNGMSNPETAAGVTKKPALATSHPVKPAGANPRSDSSRPSDERVPIPRRSPGMEDTEQVVFQDDVANTQCSEPAGDLRTKGGSLLAGHRNQGQGRSVGAGRTCQSLLRRDANGSRSLAECRLPSDSHRWRNRSHTRAQQASTTTARVLVPPASRASNLGSDIGRVSVRFHRLQGRELDATVIANFTNSGLG